MQESLSIDNLTKVSLEIWKGASEDAIDGSEPAGQVDFIFGIGASGLTDFEYIIAGKKAGDKINIKTDSPEFHALMSHFSCEFKQAFKLSPTDTCLLVRVAGVIQADNREIVSAMAGGTTCGGSCDCGCGH